MPCRTRPGRSSRWWRSTSPISSSASWWSRTSSSIPASANTWSMPSPSATCPVVQACGLVFAAVFVAPQHARRHRWPSSSIRACGIRARGSHDHLRPSRLPSPPRSASRSSSSTSLVAIFGPWLAPYDQSQSVGDTWAPSSAQMLARRRPDRPRHAHPPDLRRAHDDRHRRLPRRCLSFLIGITLGLHAPP